MSLLIYKEAEMLVHKTHEKIYLSPREPLILRLLKEKGDFPMVSSLGVWNPELQFTIVSFDLLSKLNLFPAYYKRIKLNDGYVDQPVYEITLRFYGKTKWEINAGVIPAALNNVDFKIVLGTDALPQKTSLAPAEEHSSRYQFMI